MDWLMSNAVKLVCVCVGGGGGGGGVLIPKTAF